MIESPIFPVTYVVLWALVIFQTLVLLELVRRPAGSESVDNPVRGVKMLPTGQPAPAFAIPDLYTGDIRTNESFLGHFAVLVFVSPTCTTCEAIADDLAGTRRRLRAELVLICRGDPEDCRDFVARHFENTTTLVDRERSVARAFGIQRTPAAVILDAQGRIARYGMPRASVRLDVEVPSAKEDSSNTEVSEPAAVVR